MAEKVIDGQSLAISDKHWEAINEEVIEIVRHFIDGKKAARYEKTIDKIEKLEAPTRQLHRFTT
jgi:hypothetical protein